MANPTTPAVSVIIPVHNDSERLGLCLAALDRQTGAPSFEVLVIDNNSTDDPGTVVKAHPAARLLAERRKGSYAARNRGLREARGQVLAFTDSDCIPADDWLAQGMRALQARPEADLVAGRIILFPTDAGHLTIAETYETVYGFQQEEYVRDRHYGVTANLLARRRVLKGIGPFSEDAQSGGDKEWCQRAHAAGFRIEYVPEVVVRHPMRRTLADLSKKARRTFRGELDRGVQRTNLGLRGHLFWPFYVKRAFLQPARVIPRLVRQARATPGVSAWKLVAACWYRDLAKWNEAVRVRRERRRRPSP